MFSVISPLIVITFTIGRITMVHARDQLNCMDSQDRQCDMMHDEENSSIILAEESKSLENNLIAVSISLIGSCFTALSLTIWKLASMKFDKKI